MASNEENEQSEKQVIKPVPLTKAEREALDVYRKDLHKDAAHSKTEESAFRRIVECSGNSKSTLSLPEVEQALQKKTVADTFAQRSEGEQGGGGAASGGK